MSILPLEFYQRPTIEVAEELLGKTLVRIYKNQRLSGLITEVEAYLGVNDKACHSYLGRRTPRTETMYLEGGYSYIYFIYGMHYCFNVVTESQGIPEAVLIRSLQPLEGIPTMQAFRGTHHPLKNLTTGPGKLAQALNLTKAENAKALNSKDLFIEDAPALPDSEIISGPRIGVGYAGDDALLPLRFQKLAHNPGDKK